MHRLSATLAAITLCVGVTDRGHAGETVQIAVDGQPRSYMLERAKAPGPRPTIIMLHGANGTSERVAQLTALPAIAAQEGFTTVYPQARGPVWNRFLPGTESPQALENFRRAGGIPNDIGFLKGLVADLVRRGTADPARIFISGHSNGGFMTLTMFCNEGGLFAGIGLLTSAMMEQTGADCRSAKPLPLVVINGTKDTTVPYGGGAVAPIDPNDKRPTARVWSTQRLLTFFRDQNGCDPSIERSVLPGQRTLKVEIERSTKCRAGPVVAYHAVDGNHGSTVNELPSGRLFVEFFRDRRR